MLKDQIKLFMKVALGFGHVYFAINVIFLSEIIQVSIQQIAEFTPDHVVDDFYQQINYGPGHSNEWVMRVSGVILMLSSLHLNWVMYRQSIDKWGNLLLINSILLSLFFIWIMISGVKMNVLMNSILLAIINLGLYYWIKRQVRGQSTVSPRGN